MAMQYRDNSVSTCASLSTMLHASMRLAREVNTCKLCTILLLVSCGLILPAIGLAQTEAEKTKMADANKAAVSQVEHENWRKMILKTPRPANDKCFTAHYPDKGWSEIPCKTPPNKAYPPTSGGKAFIVGNGPDFSAITASGTITETEGSFDSTSNITNECAVPCTITTTAIICPTSPSCVGSVDTNDYSLQLNSKPFNTTACMGNSAPAGYTCQGWEQFVYESGGTGFIQYWMEHWGPPGATCPAPHGTGCPSGGGVNSTGWCEYPIYGQTYCVVNAVHGVGAIPEPITNIGEYKVTAYAASGPGTTDSLAVSVAGGTPVTAPGNNYFPDLGNSWTEAEFNVFGNGNGDQAVFNDNSSLTVRIGELSGTTVGPTCDEQSFTGESNNFTLNNVAPSALMGTMPALVFTEVNPPPAGAAASCADATSIGDTHLTTFDGLYYDFQASGDFLLAQSGDFIVQTRQQSGAPLWPNATVNKAVAMQMGATRVALYIEPTRLVVNGHAETLADGGWINLPSGVRIHRVGDTYSVSDAKSNRVTADLNSIWINVTVGLGVAPVSETRGLLGNPRGSAQILETSYGAVLRNPVSFYDLYHPYADSWRVNEKESLFTEESRFKPGAPEKPFYAEDLNADTLARATEICKQAGIKVPVMFESCLIDAAVLKDEKAAKVFVHLRAPHHVVMPGKARKREDRDDRDDKRDERNER